MAYIIIDIALDALIDSVKMLPFLFLAYLLIEYIEHRHSQSIEKALAGGGKFGFVPGAVLGLFPQCGFSAMAANLYSSKVITLGTLIAVFISTSDEAIPLLIASPERWGSLAAILAAKLVLAMVAGFFIDIVLGKMLPQRLRGGYEGKTEEIDCHEHVESDSIWLAAIKHTLHIWIFILVFNLVIGAVVTLVGEETIGAVIDAAGAFQPALAGLVGLIPNCAASILLTELYAAGRLTFGGLLAGLSTGAGVGLAVLLRSNKSWKQNAFIIALLYAIGVAAGMLAQLMPI